MDVEIPHYLLTYVFFSSTHSESESLSSDMIWLPQVEPDQYPPRNKVKKSSYFDKNDIKDSV